MHVHVHKDVRHSGQCLNVRNDKTKLPFKASELHTRHKVERGGQYERKHLICKANSHKGGYWMQRRNEKMACEQLEWHERSATPL